MKLHYILPATVISLGQGFVELWRAHTTGRLFDAMVGIPSAGVAPLWPPLLLLLLMQAFDWCAHVLTAFLFSSAKWEMTLHARGVYFNSMLRQDVAWHDEQRSSELLSRLTSEPEMMHNVVNHSLESVVRAVWAIAGGAVMMLRADPALALVACLARLPLMFHLGSVAGRIVDAYWWVQQDALNSASGVAAEALSSIRTLQACTGEPAVLARYKAQIERYLRVIRISLLSETALRYVNLMLSYAVDTAILVVGAYRISQGALTLGEYTAFRTYLGGCFHGFEALANLRRDLRSAADKLGRYTSLRDREPAVPLSMTEDAAALVDAVQACSGDIVFDAVSFRYPSPSRVLPLVLKDMCFTVRARSTVALVGRSGVGKSTVFRLLERFYNVEAGRITVGGVPITQLDTRALRRCIAVVDQEPAMFNTTVMENLLCGAREVSPETVYAAARAAHVHHVIQAMPQGYDTLVGERGVKMSGGEKQRVAIARALVRNAPIWLLDEISSALDGESEAAVRAGIQVAARERGATVMIIAHRLRTIQDADAILVLSEQGTLLQQGTHAQLLRDHGGVYRSFVKEQVIDWPADDDAGAA